MSGSPIVFIKSWGKIAEVRFGEGSWENDLDVVHFLQSPNPPSHGTFVRVQTRLIDLIKTEDQLLAEMNNTTRYEIKRAAEKDSLVYQCSDQPTQKEASHFILGYGAFAKTKQLSPISSSVYLAYLRNQVLSISKTLSAEGKLISEHSYLRVGPRVRLLHTFTHSQIDLDRNFISRANRWHHWRDFLWLKAQKFRIYDFGGIYTGNEDQHKLNINRFKEGFGGLVEDGFNYSRCFSWKGKAYLLLKGLL